jgi:hypothetical protein
MSGVAQASNSRFFLALLHGEWVIVDVQSAFGPLLTVDF